MPRLFKNIKKRSVADKAIDFAIIATMLSLIILAMVSLGIGMGILERHTGRMSALLIGLVFVMSAGVVSGVKK